MRGEEQRLTKWRPLTVDRETTTTPDCAGTRHENKLLALVRNTYIGEAHRIQRAYQQKGTCDERFPNKCRSGSVARPIMLAFRALLSEVSQRLGFKSRPEHSFSKFEIRHISLSTCAQRWKGCPDYKIESKRTIISNQV